VPGQILFFRVHLLIFISRLYLWAGAGGTFIAENSMGIGRTKAVTGFTPAGLMTKTLQKKKVFRDCVIRKKFMKNTLQIFFFGSGARAIMREFAGMKFIRQPFLPGTWA
jgi:hypothetical protein